MAERTNAAAPARRARRLMPPPGERRSPAVLIVSSRHRLWQRYGPDGVFAIERALGDLVAAMAERGLAGTPVYVDDSPLLGQLGILPADPGRPEAVTRVIRELARRMAWLEEEARYVLLLGDDGVVPFHRSANPSPDGEAEVLSDHPYGTAAAGQIRPSRAVGRIPDAGLAQLVTSLRAAAAAHRRLAARRAPALADGAFGCSASVWKRAARAVYRSVGDPRQVRLSPPLDGGESVMPGADGPRFRYYNLHGLVDSPHWYGQRDPVLPADYPFFPVAVRPEDVNVAPGSLVMSEACYGAHLQGRTTQGSIALTSLAKGALGFVGATGVAYGGLDDPLVAADLLARHFWEEVLAGATAGDALARAKWRLVGDALTRQGYLDAEDEKAVRNFVLYGDPSLVHQPAPRGAEDAAGGVLGADAGEWAGSGAAVGTLPAQPSARDGAATAASSELIAFVQKTVARRLPGFTAADAQVGRVGPARSPAAKSSAAAGTRAAARDEPDDGLLVVTLTRPVTVCEGPICREVVRVTVDRDGRIRKLAVTR